MRTFESSASEIIVNGVCIRCPDHFECGRVNRVGNTLGDIRSQRLS
jgi:hypothetical protein